MRVIQDKMKFVTAIVSFVVTAVVAVPLPKYIKPCRLSRPDFNKCALEHANYAIPFIVKGNKEFDIPRMNPLSLPLVEIFQRNFKLTLRNLGVHGLEDAVVENLHINRTNVDITLKIDRLKCLGDYEVDGKLLFLKVSGGGKANVTAVGGEYRFSAELENYKRNRATHLKLNKSQLEYKLKRAYFYFNNFFRREDTNIDINKILNDSWEEVLKDVDFPLKTTVVTVIESIFVKLLQRIPENEIFLQ